MPIFEYTTKLDVPAADVFDFIARPRKILLVNPPSPRIAFLDAPERLTLGSRFTVRLTHLGFKQTLVNEVTWFEENVGFTDEQIEGPFARWAHMHRLTADGDGTTMHDRIDFEAPRGMLGWLLTNNRIQSGLAEAFAYREPKFRAVLKNSPD